MKKIGILLLMMIPFRAALGATAQRLEGCSVSSIRAGVVTLSCRNNAQVRLQAVTPAMLRVRVSTDGKFPESLPEHWGFVNDKWPAFPIKTKTTREAVWIETPSVKIKAGLQQFGLTVKDAAGHDVFKQTGLGYGDTHAMQMEMGADEHFYGLGFQRVALDVRGHKLDWWREMRWKEATVPFFMSTRGYGFYSNNTWRHTFDFTGRDASYSVSALGGEPDYYVIYGPTLKTILDRYTDLTGKPLLAPRWALGVGYQGRYLEDQKDVQTIAEGFRREDIPIDWIGLEGGWEDVPYTMKWVWGAKRFPDPDSMIKSLASMGIKMGLWESGKAPMTGYTDPEVRKKWYSPRIEGALNKGIKFFKQDDPYPRMIQSTEWLPPEPNSGLRGSSTLSTGEMTNVTNSLYSQTAMEEYTRVTGERAMIMFNGYGSSIASQRWPFTWEADFALGGGALNASLSGHSLVSTRDRNEVPDGIHAGYLAPFCYLEAWAYYKEPWLYSPDLLDMNRFYVKLRYRLVPYLYSSLHQSAESGLPVMRPMVLEYQNDPQAQQNQSQYLLGDWLLVAPARPTMESGSESSHMGVGAQIKDNHAKVYLPKGEWYDFWTGRRFTSKGEWQTAEWPSSAGGPLLVKGGAIIPMGPVTAFVDQEPLEVVRLDVYPTGESHYTVYEDDGRTYEYQKGAFATAEVKVSERREAVDINVGTRRGAYHNMPKRRAYLMSVHVALRPAAVSRGGQALQEHASLEALVGNSGLCGWFYDAQKQIVWVKATTGWRYGADSRGPQKDPEQDTGYWDNAAAGENTGYRIQIVVPQILVTTQEAALAAGGSARTLVRAAIVDQSTGKVDHRSGIPVKFTVAGPASFGSKTPTAITRDGIAEIDLQAGATAGKVTVSASAPNLPGSEAALSVYGPPVRLKLELQQTRILADGRSNIAVRVTLLDAAGQRVMNAAQAVQLSIEGAGALDCGAATCSVPLQEGALDAKVTSTTVPGQVRIHARGQGLEPAEAALDTVRGKFRLQASPPERIKLVSSGSWLKYRVNIYATIEAKGKIIRGATNTVHLHITGPAGSAPPADREVKAINGIATFNDIGFEPPAKYVFHISSDGVEPADIPIY
jgi:alpha-glucosidase (family GH31 glycosyl hydrolase)